MDRVTAPLVARLVSFKIVSVFKIKFVTFLVFVMVVRFLSRDSHRECKPSTIRCLLCLMKHF